MSKYARLFSGEYLMYLRKSRQDNPNETVEEVLMKHEIQLQEYALKNFGYRIPDKDIYREVVSGETIEERPKIQEMYERLEKENIKGVLVVDVQRLSRGDLLDCGITVRNFKYTNTLVITPTKSYDLNDKYDRKFFEMELSRGSDYLEYTKEILQRGRTASKKRGNYISSVPPYGYDKIKIGNDWTLKINEKEAYYVRIAFEMYADGIGCYVIANKLEELGAKPKKSEHFTETVIRQMLSNETYIGKVRLNERTTVKVMEDGKIVKKRIRNKNYDVIDGKHDPIISDELFEKVQVRKGSISRENNKYELKFIYAGLIKCGKCGKAIEMAVFKKNGVEYRKSRVRCKNLRNCDNMSHNYDEIHKAIINQLKLEYEDFSVKVEQNNENDIKERENLLGTLKIQLDDVVKKQESICEYLENGVYTVDMFVSRNNKLKEERERIEKAIENAEKEIPQLVSMNEHLVTFHETLDMLDDDTISAKTKNTYLKKIIDVIYYTKIGSDITLDIHLK